MNEFTSQTAFIKQVLHSTCLISFFCAAQCGVLLPSRKKKRSIFKTHSLSGKNKLTSKTRI